MLIDFHTHVFPDKIAARAIESLKAGMVSRHGCAWPSYASGTVEGLLESMDAEGVDISVMMPIATKPAQAESINRFAGAHASQRLVAFGTVHPAQENWEATLESLAAEGRRGIKLHPEFQDFYIDSPEGVRILKKCGVLGLMVTFHSGEDRLVKKSFKALKKAGIYESISEEIIRPSAEECRRNSRARSTKMRWAVKA